MELNRIMVNNQSLYCTSIAAVGWRRSGIRNQESGIGNRESGCRMPDVGCRMFPATDRRPTATDHRPPITGAGFFGVYNTGATDRGLLCERACYTRKDRHVERFAS
jgi:hypothetical protein